jgi:hypothetical protein
VQIHHIDGNPGNNDQPNLVVLCPNCHSKVTGDAGLGKSFTPAEVRKYKQAWEDRVRRQRDTTTSSDRLRSYEFVITPTTTIIDTTIDVRLGEFIRGQIDLSNPFHIDTSRDFPWMQDFITRYRNQGKWIGHIKYISPSGMKTYDHAGNLIHMEYPDVVFKTWGAIYMQVGEVKYRIEALSIRHSLINEPSNTNMKPLLMEAPGRLWINCNPHPYIEATDGEIKVRIEKHG